MSYHCFLSYTTADNQGRARRLQTALQRLAKPWYQRRMVRVYRDESNLAAEASLTAALKTALNESEHLVVLGSKNVQQSTWVNREVAFWLEKEQGAPDPTKRILVVLTEGELRWDEDLGDFHWTDETPLPVKLRGQFKTEPKFIDLSSLPGDQWQLRNASFADGVAAIMSRLLNRPKDEILSEDLKQYRRTRTVASTAVSLIIGLLLLSIVFAFRERAQRQRAEGEAQRAQDLYRVGVRDRIAMASFLRGPHFSMPEEFPSEMPVAERRRFMRQRLDTQINTIEEDLKRLGGQLHLLLILEGLVNARVAVGAGVDDNQTFQSLAEKQQQLRVRMAREMLEKTRWRYETELNAFNRSEVAFLRQRSVDLAKSPLPELPQVALHRAEIYLAVAIEFVYYQDMTTEVGRREAIRVLQHCIGLFEIAERGAEMTADQKELLREMRNVVFELQG